MTRIRGFEVVSKYQDQNINLPVRATKMSAGYDFEAAEEISIPSIWQQNEQGGVKPILIPTGIKCYLPDDEYLELANRSSNPLKKTLFLANGVGIIDADYYNNSDNEGQIMFQFINFGFQNVMIKKGERIGQGIFHKFLKADEDSATADRVSGFGSTDRKVQPV